MRRTRRWVLEKFTGGRFAGVIGGRFLVVVGLMCAGCLLFRHRRFNARRRKYGKLDGSERRGELLI